MQKKITNRLENYHRHHRTARANLYRICTCHLVFEHTSLWIASIQEGPHLQFKMIVEKKWFHINTKDTRKARRGSKSIPPVNLTWVVIFIPTTVMLAPEVNTKSAASGSP